MTEPIFVFGSNYAGRHGKGAALAAVRQHGAIYGRGVGRQGNSYAIPTKDAKLRSLALHEIYAEVKAFLVYARLHPELTFNVTKIGCGLAGYTPEDMGPMFADAPPNCRLPDEFKAAIPLF